MTLRRVPHWLEELELRFGTVLAQPLGRASGALEATPSDYDPSFRREVRAGVRSPEARIAVYQRQYWFRLLTLLQTAFPLTTRLLGHWHFNEFAARFLVAHPPSGTDLDAVSDGFDGFVTEVVTEPSIVRDRPPLALEAPVLFEAARIDAAYRRVSLAPAVVPFRPSAADPARLLEGRLELSPAVALVKESFALSELRREGARASNEPPVPAPSRLESPRHWALVRLARVPLETREFELVMLLTEYPVARALAALEASCPAGERDALPERTREWLARSVSHGFWGRLRDEAAG
jgi:hypothetical protein